MPPSSGRAACVTGATGFVGLNMVKELMIRGWDVTALHRPSSDLKLLKRFRPKLAVGTLGDPQSLIVAIPQDTDTIFHVAGNTNMWRGGNAQQTRDNVDGTRHVVAAALAKRVRRLVVTSSISAYGPVDGGITEGTPSPPANSSVTHQKTTWQPPELAPAPPGRHAGGRRPGEPLYWEGAAHPPRNGQLDEPASQHRLGQGAPRTWLQSHPAEGHGEGLLRLDGGGRAHLTS